MAEPIPSAETVEDAMRHASEQLRALKKAKPQNAAEARLHSAEVVRLQQELISATHRATDAAAAKRLNGSGPPSPKASAAGEATSLSDELITALAAGLVPFLREQILEAVTPLVARNAVCEQRIVELESHIIKLEQQPSMKYLGVWDLERTYFVGDFCTDSGSLWACDKACTGVRPGDGVCWVLAVKRGRDGKGR